jgi:hypothetical protein
MIEAKQVKISSVKHSEKKTTTDPPYAPIIIIGFFAGGLILSYIYPIKEDQYIIFIATIAITLLLILAYCFPIPPNAVESNLSGINDFLGV